VVALASPSLGVGRDVTGAPATEPPSVPSQLLVGYTRGTSDAARADARARANAVLVEVVVGGTPGRGPVELVSYRNIDRGEAMRRFTSNPTVDYAEPNWIYSTDATSNDPYYTNGSLWGMYGDGSSPSNQYGSQAAEAWSAGSTGSNSVYVGIIDEGYQFNHPDLAANAWTNPFDPVDGSDNDGNGYVDDTRGWDFNGNDNSVYDGTGDDHGTHVAGTIGARGNNGAGVAGVNWNVTFIDAKFLGPNGGTTANAVKAVDYLTDLKTRHGLNIVASNNSWGGGGYSQSLYDAIGRANAQNILFIAAAGNGGSDGRGDNIDSAPSYPASYTNPNIIAVAAINSTGGLASWSNYGSTGVDLGAPGVGIWSTVPTDAYASYSGTSMATPHVTGAAALYASLHPGSSAATIKSAILSSTVATSSLAGKTATGGRLNVAALTGSDTGGGGTTTTTSSPTTTSAPTTTTAPSGATTVGATAITYGTSRKNLQITVTVKDNLGNTVAGASVAVTVSRNASPIGSATATTGSSGTVTFVVRNAASGTYTTHVDGITASGLTWDGQTPSNGYLKQ
jgi:subtilisin family serine protease